MRIRLYVMFLMFGIGLLGLMAPGGWGGGGALAAETLRETSTPGFFLQNVGQFPPAVRFQVRTASHTVWLTDTALWLTALSAEEGVHLRLSFRGANPQARLEAFGRLPTQVASLQGQDPTRWHTSIPVWAGVRYRDLYPGIDLELTGADPLAGWRLVCRTACEAALDNVALQIEGAQTIMVGADALGVATGIGTLPVALLQVTDTQGRWLAKGAVPQVQGTRVARPFAARRSDDSTETLQAIDALAAAPTDLRYGSFWGGAGDDCLSRCAVALDEAGNAYITGETTSTNFPTTPGVFDRTLDGFYDAFLLKTEGAGLGYALFLGAGSDDWGTGVAVDAAGNAYVTGYTESLDFPTTQGAYDTSHNGATDAFVVKINPAGTALVYATLLGGENSDRAYALALDESGRVALTGATMSPDFPVTSGAYDTSHGGGLCQPGDEPCGDVFVARIAADGSDLEYATFLGGDALDIGRAIAVEPDGGAAVTGFTESPAFPVTAGALGPTYAGNTDAFLVRLAPDGAALRGATFLGGSDYDEGRGLALTGDGDVVVVGATESSDLPTSAGALDRSYNGASDAFVLRLQDNSLAAGSYLGGQGYDDARGVAVDATGQLFVVGWTYSEDLPTVPNGVATTYQGAGDGFLIGVDQDAAQLVDGSYIGGSNNDRGEAVAVTAQGDMVVVGRAFSNDFPTTNDGFDRTQNGGADAFLLRLTAPGSAPTPTPTVTTTPTASPTTTPTNTPSPTASATTTPGRYSVYMPLLVGAPQATPTPTVTPSLSPSPTATPTNTPTPTPIVQNGDFETGDFTGWMVGASNGDFQAAIVMEGNNHLAQLGNPEAMCNGGSPRSGAVWFYQTITIPDTPSPTLSFVYRIRSQDDDRFETLRVMIRDTDGNPLESVLRQGAPGGGQCGRIWDSMSQVHQYALGLRRGQTVQLYFELRSEDDLPYFNTWGYVDDIIVTP